MLVGHEEVYRRLNGGEMQQVQMVMWLAAVGRTSFTVGFEVRDQHYGTRLAIAESAMENGDADLMPVARQRAQQMH